MLSTWFEKKSVRLSLSSFLGGTILAVALALSVSPAFGQGNSWNSEVEVYPLTDLEFGQVASSAGNVYVGKSDATGGAFEVKARLRGNERIRIDIDYGGAMGGDEVPYELIASYNERSNSRIGATEMSSLTAEVDPAANKDNEPGGPPYWSAYVYVYGIADVDQASSGSYEDSITLTAEVVVGPGGGPPSNTPGGGPPADGGNQ